MAICFRRTKANDRYLNTSVNIMRTKSRESTHRLGFEPTPRFESHFFTCPKPTRLTIRLCAQKSSDDISTRVMSYDSCYCLRRIFNVSVSYNIYISNFYKQEECEKGYKGMREVVP